MKRSQPLRRSRLRRRPKRADEPLAKGRRSLTLAEYRAEKAKVRARSGGRCEVTLHNVISVLGRCPCPADGGPHHVVSRAKGGSDLADNLLDICRLHHDRVTWPYRHGKLVIRARPGEPASFVCEVWYACDKWAARRLTAPNNEEA